MRIRYALENDASAMAELLNEAFPVAEGEKLRFDHTDPLESYIQNDTCISCVVAEEDGKVIGFQALMVAGDPNKYGVEPGSGVIGTYVRRTLHRSGVGRLMFGSTVEAAKQAGLEKIDATIALENSRGRAYYKKMGFIPYAENERSIRTVLRLASAG